ncbi:fungal-specific transcription factor domain-containing protein [Fusarium tricinctum]|uniref:Fungal-specific transcription factor domain-containing protein n=1 Tax=Fusarium tricinctum TaxID=61284 RepID=A0A8K0WCA9_9HYPO|nr:fungal-specific transcription factor domain-containing protein [Fusarium tricinctum]
MFYSFQSAAEAPSLHSPTEKRPLRSPHACTDCKRRKIRCDGRQPCNQCDSRGSQARCIYIKHTERLVPSKGKIENLSKNLKERDAILNRLFPDHNVSDLVSLSGQQLRELVLHSASTGTALPSPSDSSPKESVNQDSQWDEDRRERDPLPAEADDVNALSLPLDRQASYLGISSIKAALGAMLQMRPELRALLASRQLNNVNPVKGDGFTPCCQPTQSTVESSRTRTRWSSKGQALIDAYFQRIHIFTPMLDETSFRTDYLSSQRHDSPWLSLLNMVLAMGSIVASKSSDRVHCKYYTEAMRHLDLSALGSSHIETLQALALAGGYYLHYINRPNRGDAILGAAFRMAGALGFHREPLEQDEAAEMRRRTWWSLVCLDTWTTTTLGRPSFGRFSPSIDIQPPKLGTNMVSCGDYSQSSPTSCEEQNSGQDMGMTTLNENIRFCRIATEIQDILAVAPFLNPKDRTRFDDMLINWYNHLPVSLSGDQDSAEPVHLAQCIMRWRYWNLRMLLHRSALLDAATQRGSHSELASAYDYEAIEKCQQLSKTTIEDIAQKWMSHQMSGWNAVWFLYQAVMIPLLSMLWQPQNPSIAEWKTQVQMALKLFEDMQDWSLTARCSKRVVSQIYEASCNLICRGEESLAELRIEPSTYSDQDLYLGADGLEVDDVLDMLYQDWSWDGNCTWTRDEFDNVYQ